MRKSYETVLPDGYREVLTVDATDRKTLIRLNIAAAMLLVIAWAAAAIICRPGWHNLIGWRLFAALGIFAVYIPLHELTHGAAYKVLTRRKLTFGFTMGTAYCGVPDIFVYRRSALISLLAPFTVFSVIFLAGAIWLPEATDRFYAAIVFGMHLSGCAGDLYDTRLLAIRLRDPRLLMKDTGPKQSFYLPESGK